MREKSLQRAIVLAASGAAIALSSAAGAATVGTYSSAGDLDLAGTIVYAIDVGKHDALTRTVGGVTFTDDNVTGVSVTSNNNDFDYQAPNYDGNPAIETDLEAIGRTIQWSGAAVGQVVLMNMDVTPTASYKLQLLFQDDTSGNRGFDVLVEGAVIVDNFGSSTGNLTSGKLITYEFTAGDATLNIVLDGPNGAGFGDHNAILSAATLKLVPEPTSAAMIALAFPLLLKRRAR